MSRNRFPARVPSYGGERFVPYAPVVDPRIAKIVASLPLPKRATVAPDPLSRSMRDAMVEDDLRDYQQATDVQPIEWTPIEPSPPVQYEAGLKVGPVEATAKGPSAAKVVGIVAALTFIGGAAWVGFRHADRVLAASVR